MLLIQLENLGLSKVSLQTLQLFISWDLATHLSRTQTAFLEHEDHGHLCYLPPLGWRKLFSPFSNLLVQPLAEVLLWKSHADVFFRTWRVTQDLKYSSDLIPHSLPSLGNTMIMSATDMGWYVEGLKATGPDSKVTVASTLLPSSCFPHVLSLRSQCIPWQSVLKWRYIVSTFHTFFKEMRAQDCADFSSLHKCVTKFLM